MGLSAILTFTWAFSLLVMDATCCSGACNHGRILFVHGAQSFLPIFLVKNSLWVLLLIFFVFLNRVVRVIQLNFFIDLLFVLINLKTVHFKVEVKIWDRVTGWFIIGEVQPLHVWMLKGFIDRDSLFWVKCEHPLN